jgi:hypothetical protein
MTVTLAEVVVWEQQERMEPSFENTGYVVDEK